MTELFKAPKQEDKLRIEPKDDFVIYPITISADQTKNLPLGKINIECTLDVSSRSDWALGVTPKTTLEVTVVAKPSGVFDDTLDSVRKWEQNSEISYLDSAISAKGVDGFKAFIFMLIDKFAVQGAVLLGIFFAMIALYKIMFSNDENALDNVGSLLTRGVVGIMVIMSAKFIGNMFTTNVVTATTDGKFSVIAIISAMHESIIWPLFKTAFYIMMGVLFIILIIRVFKFISGDDVTARAKQIIISTVVGLLIMIGAKQLVEGVYGKQSQIVNATADSISTVSSGFLSTANIPIIYTIINWITGLAGFVVLVLIIYQTYQLLIDPNKSDVFDNLKKTGLYTLIGLLVIGAGYLIVNVAILDKVAS